jgi:hypothetical protein
MVVFLLKESPLFFISPRTVYTTLNHDACEWLLRGSVRGKPRWVELESGVIEGSTVALGILLSFYLDFIAVLPYFYFGSVLHNL